MYYTLKTADTAIGYLKTQDLVFNGGHLEFSGHIDSHPGFA